MIILHFHLQPQFKYELFHIYFTSLFTFLCSNDFLRITDGKGQSKRYCGNKTGQKFLATGDQVEIVFHSDGEGEQGGYLLNFNLVSLPSGKWDHKEADKTQKVHQVGLPCT